MVPYPKFQLFRGQDDLYYFRLLSSNGEILLQSEGYTAKYTAYNGMFVTKLGAEAGRFERLASQDGQFYFTVKASNNKVVAVSETYETQAGLENGIRAVQNAVTVARIENLLAGAVSYPNPKYQVFKGIDGQYYFRLNARNGEILLQSEGYTSKASAKTGILSVRAHADEKGENFVRETANDGTYYFTLVADNEEIIGVSETYLSEIAREGGIRSVIEVAAEAPVEDLHRLEMSEMFFPGQDPASRSAESPEVLEVALLSGNEGESPVPNPKFQVFEGNDEQFYFRLRAQNGEIILQSEGYESKVGAEMGVGSVKRHAGNRKNYEIRNAKDGQCYFVLRAWNGMMAGQVIGISELYENIKNAESGIHSVQAVAGDALMEDLTLGALVFENPKYNLFRSKKDGQYYFHLTARNGEILLASEGYTSKSGALNGIESIRKNAALPARYENRNSEDGLFYFVLKAKNRQIIGDSETYQTEEARDNAIQSVLRLAPLAPVEDRSILEAAVA
jgi:hypothetical protein